MVNRTYSEVSKELNKSRQAIYKRTNKGDFKDKYVNKNDGVSKINETGFKILEKEYSNKSKLFYKNINNSSTESKPNDKQITTGLQSDIQIKDMTKTISQLSSSVFTLSDTNKCLVAQNISLQNEIDQLKAENEDYRKQSNFIQNKEFVKKHWWEFFK